MKRFYEQVTVAPLDGRCTVQLDGRPILTQGGQPLLLPNGQLAELLAAEWRSQGEQIDPAAFRHRDTADYALDVVAPNPAAVIEKLLGYAETDTLCYRADPDEPLFRRQQDVWDPILSAFETREGISMVRVSGVLHRPQPAAMLDKLRDRLGRYDAFTLAALEQLTALAASLCIGLEALQPDADGEALWDAASLEEHWQAEQWGSDDEARARLDKRKSDFLAAMTFARAARD